MRTAVFAALLAASVLVTPVLAQTPDEAAPATTILDHPDDTRWWISGQLNLIDQRHGAFRSPYAGDHSLRGDAESALSRVWTIYTGLQVLNRTEVFVDVESAGGRGISDALGLAGFTNLDVVRNPSLGSAPYLARLIVRYVIPLGEGEIRAARGPLALATHLPARRLELRAGKMSLPDFVDVNAVGSDSHLQFTNWTVDSNGAFDYAADTRGYTYAAIAELIDPRWTVRVAEALMPKVANGIVLDWNVTRARADDLEIEFHPSARMTSRSLAYVNHANMGSYDEALAAFHAGAESVPNIEAHRRQGRRKYGFGENVDVRIADRVRAYGRLGWNEGQHESFAYTEVNDTGQIGADLIGAAWHRAADRIGIVAVSNGLSAAHRQYLREGGVGFLLGDGGLRYGRETILEAYYTARVWRGVFGSVDGQYVRNPGYNADRGPVFVSGVRLHVDF